MIFLGFLLVAHIYTLHSLFILHLVLFAKTNPVFQFHNWLHIYNLHAYTTCFGYSSLWLPFIFTTGCAHTTYAFMHVGLDLVILHFGCLSIPSLALLYIQLMCLYKWFLIQLFLTLAAPSISHAQPSQSKLLNSSKFVWVSIIPHIGGFLTQLLIPPFLESSL